MKKKGLLLLLTAAAAVSLCLVLAYLLRQAPQEKAPEQRGGTQTLLERDAETVCSVSVTADDGQLYAVRNSSGVLEIPALDGLPVDQEKIDALAKYAAHLRAQREVENAYEALENYGLDAKSAIHVQAEFTDGQKTELWVGDEVPGTSTPSNYVLYEKTVYVMFQLHVSPFLKHEADFIRTTITPSNEDAAYVTLLLSVKHAQQRAPITVAFQNTEATSGGQLLASYAITSPAYYDMTYHERGTSFLQSIYGLQAKACFVHPEQEQLAACGLLEPQVILQAVYIGQDGEQTHLQLMASAQDEQGLAYVCLSGVDLIYQMDVSACDWYSATLDDILGRQIVMPSIKSLSGLRIRTQDTSFRVAITLDKDDELHIAADDEAQYDVAEFKKLYEVLISAEIDSLCSEAAQSPLLLEVTYEAADGTQQVVSFCEGPVRQAYVWKNGQPYGLIRSSYVTVMQEAIQKFLRNEEITVTY